MQRRARVKKGEVDWGIYHSCYIRNAYKIFVRELKSKRPFRRCRVDGRVILKWLFQRNKFGGWGTGFV
jgi:hypothetical protein